MDRFENMSNFVKVVEAGSISAAAERQGVAKSAVSRRLKELEEHLGVELFHRTTRRLNLTATGQAFYQQSLRILDDVYEVETATSQAHGNLRGRLKVALPSSFGMMHMSPAINDFLDLHPEIEFDLDLNDRQVDLIQEGFDLAIRIAELPDSSLIARRLAPIRLLVCASPGYLEQHAAPEQPQDLADHRCLTYSLVDDPQTWFFRDREDGAHNIKITSCMQASSGEFLRDAAVHGHGLAYVPSFIVYREIERGELVSLLPEYEPAHVDAWAIYPQTRHLSQRVRAFVDFLVERFAGRPYWDELISSGTSADRRR